MNQDMDMNCLNDEIDVQISHSNMNLSFRPIPEPIDSNYNSCNVNLLMEEEEVEEDNSGFLLM